MRVKFKRLTDITRAKIMALSNHPKVARHMPLAKGRFTPSDCEKFIAAKESMWEEFGYGPYAFVIEGQFAGWGGLQPENGEPDLAIVLHPDHWGKGKFFFDEIVHRAFHIMGFETITALLPPSRKNGKAMTRLGFFEDGEVEIEGQKFIRYRMNRP